MNEAEDCVPAAAAVVDGGRRRKRRNRRRTKLNVDLDAETTVVSNCHVIADASFMGRATKCEDVHGGGVDEDMQAPERLNVDLDCDGKNYNCCDGCKFYGEADSGLFP